MNFWENVEFILEKKDILKNITNSEKLSKKDINKLLKHENAVLLFMSPNDLSELENNYIELYKKN